MSAEDDNKPRRFAGFDRGRLNDVGLLAYIAAIVVFVLAAFGVTVGDFGELDLACIGLALFALGHILPR